MSSLAAWLFQTNQLSPHGLCLVWRPDLVWGFVLSDGLIAAAYFSIPAALVTFVRRRADLAFSWVFLLFGTFILLCGATHVTDVLTLWVPAYGLTVLLRVATAIASVATAAALWPLMPRALALPSAAQLHALNDELRREIAERQHAEAALRELNAVLEDRVAERTGELSRLAEALKAEARERQRIDEERRRSAELVEAVVEASPVPVAVIAADGRILMWNQAAADGFGYDAEEIRARGLGSLARDPGDDEPALVRLLDRAGRGEHLRDVPVPCRRADGKPAEISLSSAPLAANGSLRATVVILEDVTERNTVQRQLVQAQKMEAIGNLTGGMAHDFNNLLAIVIGSLDSLRPMLPPDPEAGALFDDALAAATQGADLTRRLLAFARRQPLQPRRVDPNQLVANTIKLLQRVLDANIRLSLELDPQAWPIRVDPSQLESSLVNLATNARDAMPDGGRLSIVTGNRRLDADYCAGHPELAPGDYVMIEMCDTGAGMPPEVLGRIFEPFFTTKEASKGTGLGLAMVFGFMKQSGGHINVYSEPGVGTTLRLYLPRDASIAEPAAAAAEAAAVPARGEVVLVVEDNPALRRVVLRQIRSLGYQALEAEDAVGALALLGTERVDLLFTDLVMPGEIDGARLARLVMESRPEVKLVLTSGFPGDKVDGALGPLAASVRILSKPYRKEDLARLLREALDAAAPGPDKSRPY